MTTPTLGPRQRAALRDLQWARKVAPAGDEVMTSLARKGLVIGAPLSTSVRRSRVSGEPLEPGSVEWRSTYDGSVAIGALVDDRNDPEPEQEAA